MTREGGRQRAREGGRPASWVDVADWLAVLIGGAWLGLEIGIWLVLGSGW